MMKYLETYTKLSPLSLQSAFSVFLGTQSASFEHAKFKVLNTDN